MADPHLPASLLPVLLDAAAQSPFNINTHPLLHTRRPLINQLLDNAMLSTNHTPRAIGKTRTTTALIILSIERDMKI